MICRSGKKHQFVFISASRRKKLRKYFNTVKTESASEDGTNYPQIIIIMESNYIKDAVQGLEHSSVIEPSMCDALCSVPSTTYTQKTKM